MRDRFVFVCYLDFFTREFDVFVREFYVFVREFDLCVFQMFRYCVSAVGFVYDLGNFIPLTPIELV